MNKEIIEIIKKRNIHPIGYQKMGKGFFIKDKNCDYFLKLNTCNYDIYKYLLSREFYNFPKNYNDIGDNYELREFVPSIKVEKDQKVNDLLETLALLHKKTIYKRVIDLDDIKKIYEELMGLINYKIDYFTKINDKCDNQEFLCPSNYLLIKNISLVYYLLDFSKNTLNLWYEKIKNNLNMRVCLLHNNVSLNHLVINQKKYLINWDKAMFDSPIKDIVSFYKLYYKDISLDNLFQIYEKINPLEIIEKDLIMVYLIVGDNFNFSNNELLNTRIINDELIFLDSIYNYLKEKNKSEKR